MKQTISAIALLFAGISLGHLGIDSVTRGIGLTFAMFSSIVLIINILFPTEH